MKRPSLLLIPAALIVVALTFTGLAFAARSDTVRFSSWPNSFLMMNGQPIHRFTLTPDNSTAESNLTASGETAVQYTLFGGERICLQAVTTDAYIQFIAAASVTAGGALGFTLVAGSALDANCFTLQPGTLSVSALCTASGPCLVKGFEKL
jgi:hypothetical protein